MDINFETTTHPNGEDYLKMLDIELPIRITNIIKTEIFYSKEEFYNFIEDLLDKYTSHFLFPNHYCSFYPSLEEYTSTRDTICHLSGAPIKPNETYYVYRPLLEDLTTKKIYTLLKSVQASLGYIDLFPSTLFEFEDWCYKIENAYYENDDQIDFYAFSSNYGNDVLMLKELDKNSNRGKIRKYKKIIKELEQQERILLRLMNTSINPEETLKELQKNKEKQKQYQKMII